MLHRLAGVACAVLALLVPASVAAAAPVTVNLPIEGSAGTLFEGPVTTDVRPFQFTTGADTASRQCDGTAANQGPSATPVPTRAAAVTPASLQTPFSTSGTFSMTLVSGPAATRSRPGTTSCLRTTPGASRCCGSPGRRRPSPALRSWSA